jgi:N-sulfoglucosamine sulfohydrolase
LRVPFVMSWGSKIKKGLTSFENFSADDFAPTIIEMAGLKPDAKMTGKSFKSLVLGEKYVPNSYVFSQRGAHGSGLPESTGAFDLSRSVIGSQYKLIYNAMPKMSYTPVDFSGGAFWKELSSMNKNGSLDPKYSKLFFAFPRPMFEMYDLKADPFEMNNLYGRPELKSQEKELLKALNKWMILSRDFLPLPIDISKTGKSSTQKVEL